MTTKTTFAKCAKCGNALPCFSIEWSSLPDTQKCWCVNPVPSPSPILEAVFKWLRELGK